MKIYNWDYISNFDNPKEFENVALTIGVFDGIHLGHQKLLTSVLEKNITSGIVTFSDNIAEYLHKKDKGILTDNNEKIALFESMGFDFLIFIDFSDNFAKLSCEEFIYILNKSLQIENIVVGSDFRCGHKGSADVKDLNKILNDYQIELEILSKIKDTDLIEISSSLIKEYLRKGDIFNVNRLLGRKYSFSLDKFQDNGEFLISARAEIKNLLPKEGIFQVSDEQDRVLQLEIKENSIFINKPKGKMPKRIIF